MIAEFELVLLAILMVVVIGVAFIAYVEHRHHLKSARHDSPTNLNWEETPD